jgi:hypothetical protein
MSGIKRKSYQISSTIDESDKENDVKQLQAKRICLRFSPEVIKQFQQNKAKYEINNEKEKNIITHTEHQIPSLKIEEKKEVIETKSETKHESNDEMKELEERFEKMCFKSAKVLLECSQTLLGSIDEKIKKVKELIELNHFNPDYCVDSSVLQVFKEIEQIKSFQTKANSILEEMFNSKL